MKDKLKMLTIPLVISSTIFGYQLANYNLHRQQEQDLLFARLDNNFWEKDYEIPIKLQHKKIEVKADKPAIEVFNSFSKVIPGKDLHRVIKEALRKQKATFGNKGCVNDVDPLLIACIIYRESRFNPNLISPAGAMGLLQVMPLHMKNLKEAGITDSLSKKELLEWEKNINAGIYVLMSYAQTTNDIGMALMKYNAGPSRAIYGIRYAKRILQDYKEVVNSTKM